MVRVQAPRCAPRSDIYASGLHADAYKALGLCPCCGEVECEEES